MKYVYSTLSAPVDYTVFSQGGGNLPITEKIVAIRGEAGIAGKHLQTPRGVATPVTDEDLAALSDNYIFQLHLKNGFVTIGDEGDADQVAADMNGRDNSAPLVPGDYADDKAPTTKRK